MTALDRPPVPAVPSIVLAFGNSLAGRLQWLEQRFRAEIGSQYPAHLLRFRHITEEAQVTPEALHALCDPLLVHPLWLSLRERGLAPGGERGPRLSAYAFVTHEDTDGSKLLPPFYAALRGLYAEHFVPDLCVFFLGRDPRSLPALEADRALPCFVLSPVKQHGYRTAGRAEPFETMRLALNALLTSNALQEIAARRSPEAPPGLAFYALGAAAIAVARAQMEAWARNRLLQRLAGNCLAVPGDEERFAPYRQARAATAELLGLAQREKWEEQPDEVWEKTLGESFAHQLRGWANEVLGPWGLQVVAGRRGHWRVTARAEGDLYRRLQRVLAAPGEAREEAEAALSQDVVRLANALRRHLTRRKRAVLARWATLPAQAVATGPGCLARMEATAAAAEEGLARAEEALQKQRHTPIWLRAGRDVTALAEILNAQMAPLRSAAERAGLSYAPAALVGLRLLPLILLLTAVGADLWPDGPGQLAGLGAGLSFTALAAGLQVRSLQEETHRGLRGVCRLYEAAIDGLVTAEARSVVRDLRAAVDTGAAQLQAMAGELQALQEEADAALDELAREPAGGTYLERRLSDPAGCARVTEGLTDEELMAGEGQGPAELLAAGGRGELPASALGPALIEAVDAIIAHHGGGAIETRVEEMLVTDSGHPFSAAETMEGLHERALPLWPTPAEGTSELALAVMSREAAVAFRGWLAGAGREVRLLPSLQRDRISYLRLRRLGRRVRAGKPSG